MRSTAVPLMCIGVIAFGAALPAHAQEDTDVRAYVSNVDALIVFPVSEKETWHWFTKGSNASALEYAWTIQVGHKYRIGYYLFNPGAAAYPASGSLGELLQWGQRTLWVADPETGSLSAAPPIDLELIALDGQLVMHISDEDVVRTLFSERPASIAFESVAQGVRATEGTAPIHYTGLNEKLWSGVTSNLELPLGATAPQFELPALRAPPSSKSEHLWVPGAVTVLYFWTSHCPVSRAEFDHVIAEARRWSRRGARVVGVTTREDPEADLAFLRSRADGDITHLVATAAVEEAYLVRGTPYVVVIDRNGQVAHRAMSAGQWAEAGILARKIDRLLQMR